MSCLFSLALEKVRHWKFLKKMWRLRDRDLRGRCSQHPAVSLGIYYGFMILRIGIAFLLYWIHWLKSVLTKTSADFFISDCEMTLVAVKWLLIYRVHLWLGQSWIFWDRKAVGHLSASLISKLNQLLIELRAVYPLVHFAVYLPHCRSTG